MSVIFIGGINRSGTTLLQSILCSDTSTNPLIHEVSYLRNMVDAYVSGINKFEEHTKYYFTSINDLKHFTAEWTKSFLDKVRLRYKSPRHLVLKHPPLTPKFPALNDLLVSINENPRFIIIIRDPRDVVASLVEVGERLRSINDPEGATLPRDMKILANYYMQCYMPALANNDSAYKKHLLLVKYEDLINHSDRTLDEIRNFTGLALDSYNTDDKWARDKIDYDSLKNENNAWVSDLWGSKLSSSRIGNYNNVLNENEIKLLEQVCDGPLRTFGYK